MRFSTAGINPYLQSKEAIADMLQKELPWDNDKQKATHLSYFGAGAANPAKQDFLCEILKAHFHIKKTEVQGDMVAAARALCGTQKGIVCILGTGSASCYYNGTKIKELRPSLGYIAGDEGGGNYMGKRILQYYAYGTFDAELKMGFEMRFGDNIRDIINTLYHQPNPNRYLASFVTLYFSGSVAFEFRDVLDNLCSQYELEIGNVIKSPMDGLIKYYKEQMK